MEGLKLVVVLLGLGFSVSTVTCGPAFSEFELADSNGATPLAIEYDFSDEFALQQEALSLCRIEFGGAQMATPLNKIQSQHLADYIILNHLENELFLTGGAKVNGTWEWLTTARPIESSQLFWYPGCGNETGPSYSLCFKASTPNIFGFCECSTTIPYRFICEILFRNQNHL